MSSAAQVPPFSKQRRQAAFELSHTFLKIMPDLMAADVASAETLLARLQEAMTGLTVDDLASASDEVQTEFDRWHEALERWQHLCNQSPDLCTRWKLLNVLHAVEHILLLAADRLLVEPGPLPEIIGTKKK